MTWTRISDNFPDREDLLSCSRSARLLHIEAQIWSNRQGTDGRVPRGILRRITDSEDVDGDIAELIAAAVWSPTETGWDVDFDDQEPAEVVKIRQEARALKQKRYRRRKTLHDAENHSECDPRHCKSVTRNATSNETGNKTGLVTPSRPVPSRPPTGTGTRAGRGRCKHGNSAAIVDGGPQCYECEKEAELHKARRLTVVAEVSEGEAER